MISVPDSILTILGIILGGCILGVFIDMKWGLMRHTEVMLQSEMEDLKE